MKRRNTSISKRLMSLVLSGCLLVFLVLIGIFCYGMFEVSNVLGRRGEELGHFAANYTGDFAEAQTYRRLGTTTRLHARQMEVELNQFKNHVVALAERMNHNLTVKRGEYQPRSLPDPRNKEIHSGEPYLHYAPQLQRDGVGGVAEEIRIVSNIADAMIPLEVLYSHYQMSVFVGSKNGYLIGMDIVPTEDHVVKMTEEFLASYDSRERPWYRAAERAREPIFTNIYLGTRGYSCITCAAPYYDTSGFAGVVGITSSLASFTQMLNDRSIGETETSFIVDRSNGDVLLSSRSEGLLAAIPGIQDLRKSGSPELVEAVRHMVAGKSEILPVTVDGKDCYLSFAPMKSLGWSYGILLETDEVMAPERETRENIMAQVDGFRTTLGGMFLGLAMGAAVVLILLLVLLFYGSAKITDRFSRPIRLLADGVREIAQGNLDKKLDIHTGDEIETLSESFNAMTFELREYVKDITEVASEKERIATELGVATNIQAGLLPNVFPAFPDRREFDIYATMHPAKEVGGDFYDFYLVDENHLVVTIADVSGKSVPAALFMMVSKTVLKNYAMMMPSPDDLSGIMRRANNQLCQNNEESMFVTAFIGMLDLRTGDFRYVNGGHNPPLVGRRGGETRSFEYLPMKKSCMLGIQEDREFPQMSLTLEPGDMLFLYTDGVSEAMSPTSELYTEERLKNTLNSIPSIGSVKEAFTFVEEDIRAHVQDADQSDDITMMGLVYWGVV